MVWLVVTPVRGGLAFLILCGFVCLFLGRRPKTQPYPVKTGMLCFQQRRELSVCKGVGVGLLGGIPVWALVQGAFGFLPQDNLKEVISLLFTAFLVPWVGVVWKSLDSSQDVNEVRLKLRKLVRVAAGAGVAVAIFFMSLISSGKDSSRTAEEGTHAAQALWNR